MIRTQVIEVLHDSNVEKTLLMPAEQATRIAPRFDELLFRHGTNTDGVRVLEASETEVDHGAKRHDLIVNVARHVHAQGLSLAECCLQFRLTEPPIQLDVADSPAVEFAYLADCISGVPDNGMPCECCSTLLVRCQCPTDSKEIWGR